MGTFDAQLDGAPIAVVRTTADLLAVLKKRTAGLDMTLEAANDFAGLSDGYLAKLLGPTPSRRLGSKAFDGALGGWASCWSWSRTRTPWRGLGAS